MMPFGTVLRSVTTAAMLVLASFSPAMAEDEEAPWQDVISGQIEAFREGNAEAAFGYAAEGFHSIFPSADLFFLQVVGSGYAPIMESRSHSFGRFEKLGEEAVVQEVRFVGTDQQRYEAIYELGREEAGWRVRGVQLRKSEGLGV